jgi:hypothetical protein
MENIQIPVGNNLKDKYTCRDIIIQIIIEAVTGVKIVKDQISKLSSDFIDIIDCVLKATKEKNWDKLEYCIIQLSVLLFSPKFIKIFKEILGDNAFKKFLKFSTTRFIPIVGTAFFVTELIFAIKNNWDNLQYYCYQ